MKTAASILAVAAAVASCSAALAQAGTPPVPTIADLDVPQDKGVQHVSTLVREFPVGGSSG